MTSPKLNAAQHYLLAEATALGASKQARSGQVFMELLALARLHLDLAKHAERVLLSHDSRRDPEWLEPGQGWPSQFGDVWQDTEGQTWHHEADDRLVRINDGTGAAPAHVLETRGPLRLMFRPYIPATDDPWEVPF